MFSKSNEVDKKSIGLSNDQVKQGLNMAGNLQTAANEYVQVLTPVTEPLTEEEKTRMVRLATQFVVAKAMSDAQNRITKPTLLEKVAVNALKAGVSTFVTNSLKESFRCLEKSAKDKIRTVIKKQNNTGVKARNNDLFKKEITGNKNILGIGATKEIINNPEMQTKICAKLANFNIEGCDNNFSQFKDALNDIAEYTLANGAEFLTKGKIDGCYVSRFFKGLDFFTNPDVRKFVDFAKDELLTATTSLSVKTMQKVFGTSAKVASGVINIIFMAMEPVEANLGADLLKPGDIEKNRIERQRRAHELSERQALDELEDVIEQYKNLNLPDYPVFKPENLLMQPPINNIQPN